jgi:hypothetical protein
MAELDPIKQVVQIDVKETGVDETTSSVGKLNATISETNAVNKKTEEGFKTLKVQLREAIALQQKMSQQYGSTSAEAIKATKAVAGIKDEIGFQKDLVDSYNPDDKFRKLTQTAGIAALALGGVKDGFTALGIESETLDKIIGSAQAILGVTSAVGGMSDAYAVLTANKRAKSAADVVEIGTTEALTVAEVQATTATWSWNAALLANPIVLITAGILAAGAAIYAYVKITSDAVKAEEKAKVASMQLSQAIDNQSKAFENNNKFAESSNKHKIDLLRASGASEAQIYKETKALAEQELQLAKNFRAEAILAEQKAYEANRDNPTEFNAETLKNAKENIEKAREAVRVGYDGLIDLQNSHEVAMAQAKTDARNKAIEEEKAQREKERQEVKDANEKKLKDELDYQKSLKEGLNQFQIDSFNAELEQKILQDEQEIERLTNITDVVDKIEEDSANRQKAIDEGMLLQKEQIENAKMSIAEKGIQLIAGIFGKSKAIQKGAIIAENAIGIGKQVIANNTANAGALATPQAIASSGASAVPVIALNNISTGIGIASTIAATAKALSAVGGGGASGGGSQTSTPSRNVAQVGFQGSSENQISTAIAQQQKTQPPIQAFVVSQSLTDQQELDRKKELNNSF